MTRARQQEAPGEISELPNGHTHYRWSGPDGGPVAVCIHGLSTPSYVYAATERVLATMGYHVLVYDLYGRGFSDRPTGAHSLTFYLFQLRSLLHHQNVSGPVTLVGFSMGAQIAAAFAAEEAARVKKLVLVAPAGIAMSDTGFDIWNAPLVGGWLTRIFGGWRLRRELVEHKSAATVIPDYEDRQAAETRTRGFLPAILSARRNTLGHSSELAHREIHAAGTPTLAIWGTDDPVIPLSAVGKLAEWNPDAHHEQIAGATHSMLQTHPSAIATALKDFLKD